MGVRNNGLAALAWAALVRAATGEVCDERELSGRDVNVAAAAGDQLAAEDLILEIESAA